MRRKGVVQVRPNREVEVVLFGQRLDDVTVVRFVRGRNCSVDGATDVRAQAFAHTLADRLTFTTTFADTQGAYEICLQWRPDGAEDVVVVPPRESSYCRVGTQTPPKKTYLWIPAQVTVVCLLLVLSGLFSGLNLGLMALEPTDLELIRKSGTKQERHYAEIILPVRRTGNYLLCSLLLGNVIVNSSISILFDDLTSGMVALVVSSFGIVIFGEIVPQSICVKKGLAVGARTIWITRFFMMLTAPLSWPIGKLLDCVLGEEAGVVYNRDRLIELVRMQSQQQAQADDELRIVSGALEYTRKTVRDVMTKIEDVFMLPADTVLNVKMVADVLQRGYTRIPVYDTDPNQVCALLNVKDLALLDPDDNLSVRTVCGYWEHQLRFVMDDTPLKVMLDEFKKGHYHLALVQRVEEPGEGDPVYRLTGVVTLEDIIEEIIQAEIMDETDVITDNVQRKRRPDFQLKDLSRILDQETTSAAAVSIQLQLAAVQWLSSNVAPMGDTCIANGVLQRLVRQHVRSARPSQTSEFIPAKHLYRKGESSDKFVLVLEGRVQVTIGKGNLTFEAGPFHCFGQEVLLKMVELAPGLTAPGGRASLSFSRQSLPSADLFDTRGHRRLLGTFVADYTVTVNSDVTYLQVSAGTYLSAYRASLIERGRAVASLSAMKESMLSTPSPDGVVAHDFAVVGARTPSPLGSRHNSVGGASAAKDLRDQLSAFSREDANRATIGSPKEAQSLIQGLAHLANGRRPSLADERASCDTDESPPTTARSAAAAALRRTPSVEHGTPTSEHSRANLIVRVTGAEGDAPARDCL